MHILATLIISLAKMIHLIAYIYQFIIAGVVIVSWVGADPYNPIVRFLHQATEPLFWRIRKIMPKFLFRTGIDFTPMLVLVLLFLIDVEVVNLLYELAQKLLSK